MKKCIWKLLLFILFLVTNVFSQTIGNIPLYHKTKFNRYFGAGDVWGVKINNINYALVTLDGGLSIVNTNTPSNPTEIAYIDSIGYVKTDPSKPRIFMPDVETYTKNGITYAYLATNKKSDVPPLQHFPLVMIINLNEAISLGGEILIDPHNPSGSVYVGKIDDFGASERSHTLTIAGNYLYVATLNDSLPVWDISAGPTNPQYLGFITVNPSDAQVHEMYVKSTSSNSARVYAATLTGGLQVLELSYIPIKGGSTGITVNNRIEHLYDFDRAYPNQRWSGDFPFDYRFTHSAWPTDDEQYIFTTEELDVDWMRPSSQYSGGDPNLYSVGTLKTPRREGAFLRTWQASLLGNNDSFKGGFYVSEDYYQGITDLTIIDTNWVPNSIHQMFVKGSYLYLSHYTQGFRMLEITDPENIIEVGYYDDFPLIDFDPSSNLFFRQNWFNGIYGIFPDQNRPNICYAGGSDGFYIFDVTPPPYAPKDLTVDVNGLNQPVCNWTPSTSPNIDKVNIYRTSTAGELPATFSLIATINAFNNGNPVTSWTDVDPYAGTGNQKLWYTVSVVNTSGLESVQSNTDWVPWDGSLQKKGKKRSSIAYQFKLYNNYPNPFNPSTEIKYSIAKDSYVIIKIYDMLGNEVKELVNEMQSAGNYSVNFISENLSSGVYIYRITASDEGRILFNETKQMILLK